MHKKKKIGADEALFQQVVLLQEMVYEDLRLDKAIADSPRLKAEYAAEMQETILNKSRKLYNEMIDSFPKSVMLFRALNNKAFIELSIGDTAEAIRTFSTILESTANDREKGGIGSGVMGEPYANYKNRAAKMLAIINIEAANWKDALTYLNLTQKYPYRHFCGNEIASDQIYMAELYGKCYIGLQDYKSAYRAMLPNILENGLADNSDLVKSVYEALLKTYDKAALKSMFEQAFREVKTAKIKRGKNEYERHYILYLDTEIELDSFDFYIAGPKENDKVMEKILNKSKFYALVSH